MNLLDFSADLRQMGFAFWMLLGEAKSKCEHISSAPLLPEIRAEMHKVYLIKGIQATTAIEGNTLTEAEIRDRVENRSTLPPSREYLGKETDNVLAAINALLTEPQNRYLSLEDLFGYNTSVLRELDLSEGVVAGELRKMNVGVGSYRCPAFETVPQMMGAFVEWFNNFPTTYGQEMETQTAIIKAILSHIYFVLIHPFGDGNGRTGRFLEWRVLNHAGVPTAATHLLSNHYNQTRSAYYRHLEKVSATGEVSDFLSYAVRGFVDQLADQLKYVKRQQYELAYGRYVADAFAGETTETAQRRRELAMAILRAQDPVVPSVVRTLTPALAAAYGGKTQKTITRDLNALLDAALINEVPGPAYTSTLSPGAFRHVRPSLQEEL